MIKTAYLRRFHSWSPSYCNSFRVYSVKRFPDTCLGYSEVSGKQMSIHQMRATIRKLVLNLGNKYIQLLVCDQSSYTQTEFTLICLIVLKLTPIISTILGHLVLELLLFDFQPLELSWITEGVYHTQSLCFVCSVHPNLYPLLPKLPCSRWRPTK